MKKEISNIINHYLNELAITEKKYNGQLTDFLHQIRTDAKAKLSELNFPTIKNEDWKYTDVSPILSKYFRPTLFDDKSELDFSDLKDLLKDEQDNILVVFVNGFFIKELSNISEKKSEVNIENLSNSFKSDAELLSKHFSKYLKINDSFSALNSAFAREGVVVQVSDNQVVEKPIHVIYINGWNADNSLIQPRNLILIGKNSKVKLIETNIGINSANYFFNSVAEIRLEDNSALEHYRVQTDSMSAYNISRTQVAQLSNSNYSSVTITLGGNLVRNDLSSSLIGEGADCNLYGLYFVNGEQHVDNHTLIEHAIPHCHSNELYKGILGGRSRGVFNGKVFVHRDAQKTNAYQSNKNILLSRDARIDTKPQLEIFADDVKCTHGATVGQIDDESLFYLQSRGIARQTAFTLLIHGFANDVLESITIDKLKFKLEKLISEKVNSELKRN